MLPLLEVVMILPGAVGVCCAVGDGSSSKSPAAVDRDDHSGHGIESAGIRCRKRRASGMTMANPLKMLTVFGLVTVFALTVWLVFRLSRRPGSSRIAILEAMSMFGSVLVMAGVGM